jgi:hypothetical protein
MGNGANKHLQINGKEAIAAMNEIQVEVDMYENKVRVRGVAALTPRNLLNVDARKLADAGTRLTAWTATPGSYKQGDTFGTQPTYSPGGTLGVVLAACAYYDPSLKNVQINQFTGQFGQGLQVGTAGRKKESPSKAETGVLGKN